MKIALKFISQGPINNIPALVQIMAWRRSGDKPLSEPMVAYLNDAYTVKCRYNAVFGVQEIDRVIAVTAL